MPGRQSKRGGGRKKNKGAAGLGKALWRNKKKQRLQARKSRHPNVLNTTTMRPNGLVSMLDSTSLSDFLETSKLARRNFTADRENVQVVRGAGTAAVVGERKELPIDHNDDLDGQLVKGLKIPRRPSWHVDMQAEELDLRERESFLAWRRSIAELERSNDGVHAVTPFEKNLQVWRQLWRVMERSDVIVQIVDARNPALFRCEDLEAYARETTERVRLLLLLNKADYLTPQTRHEWASFFNQNQQQLDTGAGKRFHFAFVSAKAEQEILDAKAAAAKDQSKSTPAPAADPFVSMLERLDMGHEVVQKETQQQVVYPSVLTELGFDFKDVAADNSTHNASTTKSLLDTDRVLTRDQLLGLLNELKDDICAEVNADDEDEVPDSSEALMDAVAQRKSSITVGLVGFPNVGKSSLINMILGVTQNSHGSKRVSVAARPGKTKHLQTLPLDACPGVVLCDCPGLVFPSFVDSKANMIVNGILPIDQMRNYVGPMALIAKRIPLKQFKTLYGLHSLHWWSDDGTQRLTWQEAAMRLLGQHASARGFRTSRHGGPDRSRSARILCKDYVSGKLLFTHSAPGSAPRLPHDAGDFHSAAALTGTGDAIAADKSSALELDDSDEEFFNPVMREGAAPPLLNNEQKTHLKRQKDIRRQNKSAKQRLRAQKRAAKKANKRRKHGSKMNPYGAGVDDMFFEGSKGNSSQMAGGKVVRKDSVPASARTSAT